MKLSELLNRDFPCSCGRTHRCDIRSVEIGQGVLEKISDVTDSSYHDLKLTVSANGQTEEVTIEKQCASTLTAYASVFVHSAGNANNTITARSAQAYEKEYTKWTFSDADIANGKVAAGRYGAVQLGGKNIELDGSQFRGYVTFHALNTANMWGWDTSHLVLGTNTITDGQTTTGIHFAVEQSGEATYLVCGAYTEGGNNAKKHTFENIPIALGTETLLEISFDYSVNSTDSRYYDLKLTVSASEKTEQVVIEKQRPSTTTAYASVYVDGTGDANNTITARSVQTPIKEYTKWTFNDAEIAEGKVATGTYGAVQLNGSNVELGGSQFRGYVTFHALNAVNMWGWDTSHLVLGTNTITDGQTTTGIHFAVEQSGEATYLVCGAYTEGGNNAKKHTFENIPIVLGTETLLEISFDYSVNSTDSSYYDLKLTVSASEKTEQVVIEKQRPSTTTAYASVYVDGTGDANNTITARSVREATIDFISADFLQERYFRLIAECGINLVTHFENDYSRYPADMIRALEWAEKYHFKLFVNDKELCADMTEEELTNRIAEYGRYQSFGGIKIIDEPCNDKFPVNFDGAQKLMVNPLKDFAPLARRLNSYDNLIGYINLFPYYDWMKSTIDDYKEYVEEFLETCNPKMISYDNYPFDLQDREACMKDFFVNLSIIRSYAKKCDIPFWAFAQCGSQWNFKGVPVETEEYRPTKWEFFWSVNVELAFGAKGIEYYPLVQPYGDALYLGGGLDCDRSGILGADGEPTMWHGFVRQINKQVNTVGAVLMKSDNMGVIATEGALSFTRGLEGMLETQQFRELTSVETEGEGAFIGCFDYEGKTALYVVNNGTKKCQNMTLHFNDEYQLQLISSVRNDMEEGEACQLTLGAGAAVLIIITGKRK